MRKLRYALIGLLIASSCQSADYQPRCNLFKAALVGMGLFSIPNPVWATDSTCSESSNINNEETTMATQNSIYAPTPFAVNKGGTGINAPMTDGQLWIGATGVPTPFLNELEPGTNIDIINGPGTILINTKGPASMTWTHNVTGTPTNYIMSAGHQGYTTQQSGIVFRTPTNPSLGDIYIMQAYWTSAPGTGFSIIRNLATLHSFQYNGVAANGFATTNANGVIAIQCVDQTGGVINSIFSVLWTNGVFA